MTATVATTKHHRYMMPWLSARSRDRDTAALSETSRTAMECCNSNNNHEKEEEEVEKSTPKFRLLRRKASKRRTQSSGEPHEPKKAREEEGSSVDMVVMDDEPQTEAQPQTVTDDALSSAGTGTTTTSSSASLSSDNSGTKLGRHVHFEPEGEQIVHTYPKEVEDASALWWTAEGNKARKERNGCVTEHHQRSDSDFSQAVTQLWKNCSSVKNDEVRPPRRRAKGGIPPPTLLSTENNPLFSLHRDELDHDGNDEDDQWEARGLEDGIVAGIGKHRKNAVQSVLDAQRSVSQMNPAARGRVLSKTAAHASGSDVRFAKAVGDADAVFASQYLARESPNN